jgi:AbrB family looped-hinge helix DNA binding protein
MTGKPKEAGSGCCRVEALIGVDERGQMVLPKEVRDAAGIRAGDKLALILWRKNGTVCCMTLVKADELTDMVRGRLGPLMKGIIS